MREQTDYLEIAQKVMSFINTRKKNAEVGIYWSVEDAAAGRDIYYDEISMYSGASGIINFLLTLYQADNNIEHLEEAEEAAQYIIWRWHNKRELKRNFSPYAYSSGWCGASFAAANLYKETKKQVYKDFVQNVVEQLIKDAKPDPSNEGFTWSTFPGIVGDAGTILTVLNLAQTFERDDWREFAVKAGRRYPHQARDMGDGFVCYDGVDPVYFKASKLYVDPNFPMGTAGIGYLLLKLYEASADRAFLDAVKGVPEYMQQVAVSMPSGKLLPHGLPDRNNLFYLGYCHGPAGTVRFYYELSQFEREPGVRVNCKQEIDALIAGLESTGAPKIRSDGYWNTYNYCCGTAGILHMYLGLWASGREEKYLKKAEECAAVILEGMIEDESSARWRFALDRIAPDKLTTPIGEFDGAAGIGMALLELYLAEDGKYHIIRNIDDPFPA